MLNKLSILILATAGALSFAAGSNQPNQYECTGAGVDVLYSTSSLAGKPTMSIRSGNEQGRAYYGDEIRMQDSVMGSLVTVTKQAVPDFKVDYQTLVVPAINLHRGHLGEALAFDTVLIETTARTSIAGPTLVQGQVESSTYLPVKCTAKQVVFDRE